MWPVIIGIGVVALIANAFSKEDPALKTYKTKNHKKKIFISFAIEDKEYRDHLVAQSKSERSPFTFIDMSVKHPWEESVWREKCRIKIKSCDGVIVMLSGNTYHSSGTRFEIKCAKEEKVPIVGMHIRKWIRKKLPLN